MKVSTAAVLISLSSASAFNVGYLNQLNGPAAPAKAAPEPKAVVGGGPSSYLDNLNGTPELVSAIESAPAPASPAPSSVTSTDYLSALNSNAPAAISGAGITGYLDVLTSNAPITGGGVTSYLDTMSGAPAAPEVVTPAPVAAAPAAPTAPTATEPVVAAPSAGNYLSTLDTGSGTALSGAGLAGYLQTLASNTSTSGAGLTSYLDVLHSNASQTSGAGLTGYLDALKTNTAIAGTSSSSPSVSSFLENVYNQILSLPDDASKKVMGSSLTFAAADGPYSMAFVKN